jgi:hypothetical protein
LYRGEAGAQGAFNRDRMLGQCRLQRFVPTRDLGSLFEIILPPRKVLSYVWRLIGFGVAISPGAKASPLTQEKPNV